MLRLAECLPAMTPQGMIGLPWGLAWSLIHVRRAELEAESDEDADTGRRLPKAEPLPMRDGGHHAPGMSQLMRIFGRG